MYLCLCLVYVLCTGSLALLVILCAYEMCSVVVYACTCFISCFLVQMANVDSTLDVHEKHWIVKKP